eukprot:NODE_4326_length_827_cov_28.823907_g3998_i0.p1 GENE.NODE_4326_length_827_cov_28.823907_g3998_i0~~NODE_4326_length_827_cov_28.823907_g3998_i0.p1  ORF type:complete len:204 (-),score=30.10 NODE_4326_length_827_cov_28.823907_g3998_i0:215-769(-)
MNEQVLVATLSGTKAQKVTEKELGALVSRKLGVPCSRCARVGATYYVKFLRHHYTECVLPDLSTHNISLGGHPVRLVPLWPERRTDRETPWKIFMTHMPAFSGHDDLLRVLEGAFQVPVHIWQRLRGVVVIHFQNEEEFNQISARLWPQSINQPAALPIRNPPYAACTVYLHHPKPSMAKQMLF